MINVSSGDENTHENEKNEASQVLSKSKTHSPTTPPQRSIRRIIAWELHVGCASCKCTLI